LGIQKSKIVCSVSFGMESSLGRNRGCEQQSSSKEVNWLCHENFLLSSAKKDSKPELMVHTKDERKSIRVDFSMQLHTGAEDFGNVIFRYSELSSQYHFDASIDVNRM
jgi:hypothetical protein